MTGTHTNENLAHRAGSGVLDKEGNALCILCIYCCGLSSYPTFFPPLSISLSPSLPPSLIQSREYGRGDTEEKEEAAKVILAQAFFKL